MLLILLLTGIGQLPVMAQADTETNDPDLPGALRGVGVDEQLGDFLPRDAQFLDSQGQEVTIGDYLDNGRPLLVNFIYHNCPMLCSITLEALGMTLSDMQWTPGQEFDVVSVSFGAGETPEMAARAKERMLAKLDREGAAEGWHFLVGDSTNIALLTQSVGYSFKWVASTQEYAHPAALIFTGDDGKVTRYLHGLDLPADDVRKALVEASEGTVGSAVDQILMYCYQYDPDSNSYVIHATNLMKFGGMLTLIVLGIGLFVFWRRESDGQSVGIPRPASG
ncbi:MAG: SCO family protein [Rhodothermales bacterium]